MNFKDYVNKHLDLLNEVKGIDLINNFKKVFPFSKESNLTVKHFNIKGEDTDTLEATGTVSSESDPGKSYVCMAKFHREDNELPFSLQNMCKVSCDCDAYRYNLSHPNTKNSSQAEPIPGYASIANTIRNPDKNVGVCKHLYAFLHFLYEKGIIRNN